MSHLILNRESYESYTSISHKYVRSDIEAWYRLCNEQSTIPKDDNDSYDGILNEDGFKLLRYVEELVKNNSFNGFFPTYHLGRTNSGAWFTKKESPFYKESECSLLNSWDNIRIEGRTQDMIDKNVSIDQLLKTSPVILYTDSWCWTQSHSLYKLGQKLDPNLI